MVLILLCLHITVINCQYNFDSVEYAISREGEVINSTITQADRGRGIHAPIVNDPSSRLGLAYPLLDNSSLQIPELTPRMAPSPDDPSINEIDSADYFPSIGDKVSNTTEKNDSILTNITHTENKNNIPSNNVNITTSTEQSDIVWGFFLNNSGIFTDSNDRVGIFEFDWDLSTNSTTEDTGLTAPAHPASLVEFINAQLSLLSPMWSNFFKLTDHYSREIIDTFSDTVSAVWDFIWEIIDVFFLDIIECIFSETERLAIDYDSSEL